MKIRLISLEGEETPLEFTTEHPQSSYGLGVLLFPNGDILDGNGFRSLRDGGARIVTDSPDKIREALGVPLEERGIFRGEEIE